MHFIFLLLALLLLLVAIDDWCNRTVRHIYLVCLAVLLLSTWYVLPNYSILPYSALILLCGFVLHIFKVLGAGDTKLLVVLSLGVAPEYLLTVVFVAVILGGGLSLVYFFYGLFTDLAAVRRRGVPYAIPISIAGGLGILLTHIS
ncbi:prepilin peptidase [Marinomonas fungiae]|uniref:prepilin peptidase n=1 Tax=Marinomonas fungiae TaxID=1137284 RepID=UPI003A9548CE